MNDPVNHPDHYTKGECEVIDVIESWKLGFHAGNVVKYIARYRHKGSPIEDLEKARWYLDRLIAKLKEKHNSQTLVPTKSSLAPARRKRS